MDRFPDGAGMAPLTYFHHPEAVKRQRVTEHHVPFSRFSSWRLASHTLLIPNQRHHTMRFYSLVLLLATASAFTVPYSHSTSRSSNMRLYSSTTPEKTAVETAAVASSKLEPEFQQALEKAQGLLEASIGEEQKHLLALLLYFMREYFEANQASYKAGNTQLCSPDAVANRFLDGIQLGMTYGMGKTKYRFGVSHTAMRGNPELEEGNTRDYYAFGCDFFRPCMNLEASVVLGKENLDKAFEQIKNGENVVFLANHQSEADPQVVSCMLEKVGYGPQAEQITYVAGHKVTTDPLAIPFSMGRNLVCIHSKKHIDSDPDTKPLKQKQNLLAMGGMLNKLKEGGCCLWVAPSGGRDRRNVETGEVPIADFDSKTIDMFRLMGNKSKVPTHYYPLAMVTYDLCPPPDYIEAGVGEQRNVRFVPVGIACGTEVESVGGLEKRHEFCDNAFAACQADYERLLAELKP